MKVFNYFDHPVRMAPLWNVLDARHINVLPVRREENQLDVTECFIALMIRSTCFGHFYAHHQELETICELLPPMVCSAWLLVVGVRCRTAGYASRKRDFAPMLIIRSSRQYVCYYCLWCAVLGCWLSGVRCRTAGYASRKSDVAQRATSFFLDS